jgi:hypothetical protein
MPLCFGRACHCSQHCVGFQTAANYFLLLPHTDAARLRPAPAVHRVRGFGLSAGSKQQVGVSSCVGEHVRKVTFLLTVHPFPFSSPAQHHHWGRMGCRYPSHILHSTHFRLEKLYTSCQALRNKAVEAKDDETAYTLWLRVVRHRPACTVLLLLACGASRRMCCVRSCGRACHAAPAMRSPALSVSLVLLCCIGCSCVIGVSPCRFPAYASPILRVQCCCPSC